MTTDCLIWGPSSNQNAIALYEGVKSCGFTPEYLAPSGFHPNEHINGVKLCCVLGLRPRSKAIFNYYTSKNIPTLVIDSAYILRSQKYMQLGLNGLNWLPPDAPHDRAKTMGLIPEGTAKSKRGDKILLCRQKPGDAQHEVQDVDGWLNRIKKQVQRVSDREIIDRPHPQVAQAERPLADDLADAWCIVTYNSTAAYEALLAGVPVFCDEVSVYKECANTDFNKIESPYLPAKQTRQKLFDRLTYAQWTLDEIKTGKPINWVLGHAGGA